MSLQIGFRFICVQFCLKPVKCDSFCCWWMTVLIFIYKKTEQTCAEFQIYALYPDVITFNVTNLHWCTEAFQVLFCSWRFTSSSNVKSLGLFLTQQFIATVAFGPADKGSSCACFWEIVEWQFRESFFSDHGSGQKMWTLAVNFPFLFANDFVSFPLHEQPYAKTC